MGTEQSCASSNGLAAGRNATVLVLLAKDLEVGDSVVNKLEVWIQGD